METVYHILLEKSIGMFTTKKHLSLFILLKGTIYPLVSTA